MTDFTTMRSSSWLIACSAASARSIDVIAIASLRKIDLSAMIGPRAADCQATRQSHDPAAVGLEHLSGEVVCVLGRQEDGAVGHMHEPRDVLTSVRLELARFPAVLEALPKDLDAATWRAPPAVADWAPVQIGRHLRDE